MTKGSSFGHLALKFTWSYCHPKLNYSLSSCSCSLFSLADILILLQVPTQLLVCQSSSNDSSMLKPVITLIFGRFFFPILICFFCCSSLSFGFIVFVICLLFTFDQLHSCSLWLVIIELRLSSSATQFIDWILILFPSDSSEKCIEGLFWCFRSHVSVGFSWTEPHLSNILLILRKS